MSAYAGRKPGTKPSTKPPSLSGKTNVQITTETRDRLVALGGKGDSYEDVIKRVLDEREVALDYDPFFVSKAPVGRMEV